jgi:cytidine deaminase
MEKEKLIEKIEDRLPELIEKSIDMRNYSYAPYSKFRVGAGLLAANGNLYGGCNIENAALAGGSCAERTALCKAVSEGVRSFEAIAVVGGNNGVLSGICAPCGVCRQVLREFCDPETFRVILGEGNGLYQVVLLKDLLPMSFGPEHLRTE